MIIKKILFTIMLVSFVGYGQEIQLDPITITVNVTKKDPSNVVEVDSIIKSEDIAKTLDNQVNFTAFSDGGNFKGYSYFRVRGMAQNKMSIEFDGIPLMDAEDNGLFLSNFGAMLNQVGSISVEKGATVSGLSASYAGRINLTPDFEDEFISVHLGSWGNKDINVVKKLGNFKVGGSTSYTKGYRDSFKNTNSSAFVTYKGKDIEFNSIIGTQSNKLAWLGSLETNIEKNRRHNQSRNEYDKFIQTLSYLKYSTGRLVIQPYNSYLRGGYDFNLNSFLYIDGNSITRYELEHNRYGLKTSYLFNIWKIKNTIEVNGSLFSRKHWGEGYDNVGTKNEIATTLKSEYKLKNFRLFSIVQERSATFDYRGDIDFEKKNWNFLNIKTGLGYKNLYYNFGKISREPTRTDMFGGEENLIKVVNIMPETAYSHELGYKGKFIKVNGYYSNFKNEIALNGLLGSNSLPLNSNVSKSERYGLEYDISFNMWLNVRVYGDFSRGMINNSTYHVLSPQESFNIDINRQIKGIKIGLSYKYISKSFINTGNTYSLPEFHNLDLSLSRTFKSLEFSLDLNNITNYKGYNYGNINVNGDPVYIVNPTINFLTGIKWKL